MNLEAFHNLLQKFLYPSTRLRSKFISLLPDAREVKVSLKASVPYGEIPNGNSFLVVFFIFSFRFGTMRFSVLLSISFSKAIPSITSIGSIILPFDLDIF